MTKSKKIKSTPSQLESNSIQFVENRYIFTSFVNGATPKNVQAFKSGDITAGLFDYSGVLFFLCRIKGFKRGWLDAPYCSAIQSFDWMLIPDIGYFNDREMKFILTDQLSEEVCAVRTEILPSSFCNMFERLSRHHLSRAPKHNHHSYSTVLKEAYAKWPSAAAMLSNAVLYNFEI